MSKGARLLDALLHAKKVTINDATFRKTYLVYYNRNKNSSEDFA